MYAVSSEQLRQLIESGGVYGIRLESDSEIITADELFSADGEQSSTSLSDDIELGAVTSAVWRTRLSGGGEYLGKRYKLSLFGRNISDGTRWGDLRNFTCAALSKLTIEQVSQLNDIVGGELIPMGEFTCVKARKNGGDTELSLYDRLYFSDKEYIPKIQLPAMSNAVEDDICKQLGLTNGNSYAVSSRLKCKTNKRLYGRGKIRLRTGSYNFQISFIPEGATMRQVLSYIASAQGSFGYVDRFGRYMRRWYGSSIRILDDDTIDEPTLSEKPNKIVGIICTAGDKTLTQGVTGGKSGRILEIENPYMTETLLRSLFYRIKDLEWYTAQVFQRLGDPRLDIGDTVTYESGDKRYNVPVTTLAFNYDGGLSADISAVGISAKEQLEI